MNLLELAVADLSKDDWEDIRKEFKECLLQYLRDSVEDTQYIYDFECISDVIQEEIQEYVKRIVKEEINKMLKKNNTTIEKIIIKSIRGEFGND